MSGNPTQPIKNVKSFEVDREIDTSGTRCPMPLLLAKKAFKQMTEGQVLRVLATDPAAKPDFEAMLRHLPHTLLAYQQEDDLPGKFTRMDTFIIRKGGE